MIEEENNINETIIKVAGMYKEWFLDYASYVILERAIPALNDGFKPVQRRIMQSMKDLDDGRYSKVANLVGHTMQYHPHGDASIADAMVQIGQKDLLIDTQGNWGNILTGDGAAASRYIEARLSKFALEVLFNPKVTVWQASYDGRKKEPIHLPVKFPLLLAQGAEGIAVGLSTKIMPHNFNELIDASVQYLRRKNFIILPDFLTGGIADFSNYNDGKRGSRIRIRAKIKQLNNKTLIIDEIPYGTTTGSLIESIIKANERGKIKIKHIEDNTAATVAILIHLPPNISPDKTIDALYAFTNCEVFVSPLCCVIQNHKPVFLGVSDLLKQSTDHTISLLKKELNVQLNEFENQWHFACLERIFIENRIYRDIEEIETWEGVLETIEKGLRPHIKYLKRAITQEDIIRLTDIKIKRISKFDIDKATQFVETLESQIQEIRYHLDNLVSYTIAYFKKLKQKYGKNKTRRTQITNFDDIVATKVVIRNEKLYANRKEGFIGTSMKKDEYISDCSDIDDVIVFTKQGKMVITKISTKIFVGKDIIYVAIFKRNDKRMVYNMMYRDGAAGATYMKRFVVTGITRNKKYDLTAGNKDSLVHYFSANPNGEAEKVTINLKSVGSIKKLKWDIDFALLSIKGRTSKGNLVTKLPVRKIVFKIAGGSTLKPLKIWFDKNVQRLNTDEIGELLGEFSANDKLLIITQRGVAKVVAPDLNMHFEKDTLILEKWNAEKIISVIYYEGTKKRYFVKRFILEQVGREELFIGEHPKNGLVFVTTEVHPAVNISFAKKTLSSIKLNLEDFIDIKGIKALGNQLTLEKIKKVTPLSVSTKFSTENSKIYKDKTLF